MSNIVETVVVEREGHPDPIVVNKSDVLESDIVIGAEDLPKEGSVKWLIAKLEAASVEIPEGAKKKDLQELFDGIQHDPE